MYTVCRRSRLRRNKTENVISYKYSFLSFFAFFRLGRKNYLRICVGDFCGPVGPLSGAGYDSHHFAAVLGRDLHGDVTRSLHPYCLCDDSIRLEWSSCGRTQNRVGLFSHKILQQKKTKIIHKLALSRSK
jgi:hypothetical protein